MKKSYSSVMAEISRLQKEAERLRKTEVDGVIARIRTAITAYDLSAEDLGFAGKGAAAAPARRAKYGSKGKAAAPANVKKGKGTVIGVPKYADPKTGKTWTGRGKPPGWIAGAKDREAFAIARGATEANPAAAAA